VGLNRFLKPLEGILGPAQLRDDVVEAVYLAMRLISHNATMARNGVSAKEYLDRQVKSSKESRRLALRVKEEIVRRESAPLHKVPQARLDQYTVALSELLRRRLKQDLQYDEERGLMLLEEMRRAG
jgi:hypothetical protein